MDGKKFSLCSILGMPHPEKDEDSSLNRVHGGKDCCLVMRDKYREHDPHHVIPFRLKFISKYIYFIPQKEKNYSLFLEKILIFHIFF